jgi:pimeloyl-ACP methyl ester carboxylesterase
VTTLARELTKAADVRTVTIPGATHFVHLDRPDKGRDAFVSEVRDFLAKP